MARLPDEYLADMLEAIAAIRTYTRPGKRAFLRSAMVRDAVIARILQIGEAVKAAQGGGIDLATLAPQIPWPQIAGMRDILSHQYCRTDPQTVWAVVEKDLKPLEASVRRLRSVLRRAKGKK
jgi:uncharacterized protein with HEPN domain